MADSKISQLPAVTTPNDADFIPGSQGGITKKFTIAQVVLNEATARAAADTTITNNLNTEITNRTNADTALQAAINGRIARDGSVVYTANQPMGGFKLVGLSAGTAVGESVRYEQVVLRNGVNAFTADQSMAGFKLTSVGNPTTATDVANRGYVLGLKLHDFALATASVNLNNHKLINVLDPTLAQDAVTLGFLKNQASWNLSSGSGFFDLNTNSTFTIGTDPSIQYSQGSNITSNRIINVVLPSLNFSTDFAVFIPELFTIAIGSTLTIQADGGTLKVLGAGTYGPTAFRFLYVDGSWNLLEYPIYRPKNSSTPGDTVTVETRWVTATYDFSVSGGSLGTKVLPIVLPDGAILLRNQAVIETVTAFTSPGDSSVSWGYGASPAAISAAHALPATPYSNINYVEVGLGATPNTDKLTTAANVTFTITVGPLTAGKANLHIPYIINKF